MGKNIDLIAITFLLVGVGLIGSAKHVVVMGMSGPVHYIRLDCGQQVRVPSMPAAPRVPMIPHLPNFPLNRD